MNYIIVLKYILYGVMYFTLDFMIGYYKYINEKR